MTHQGPPEAPLPWGHRVGRKVCSGQGVPVWPPWIGTAPLGCALGQGPPREQETAPRAALLENALTSRVTAQEERSIVEWVGVGRTAGCSLFGRLCSWVSQLPNGQAGRLCDLGAACPPPASPYSSFTLPFAGALVSQPLLALLSMSSFWRRPPPVPWYWDGWERRQRVVLVVAPELRGQISVPSDGSVPQKGILGAGWGSPLPIPLLSGGWGSSPESCRDLWGSNRESVPKPTQAPQGSRGPHAPASAQEVKLVV